MKHWVIYLDGKEIGVYPDDMADDDKDACLNWADEWLQAELKDI